MEQIFGQHVHWGYWENPKLANGSIEDFQNATKALSEKLLALANIVNGQDVLEVGCGFGGTISIINDLFNNLKIKGLNIDQRQIDRAKEKVFQKNGNEITFIQGDACKLPFEANSFDLVLAVECIFHFPDRRTFFSEANRVLKQGGRLVLSDFVLSFCFRPDAPRGAQPVSPEEQRAPVQDSDPCEQLLSRPVVPAPSGATGRA